MAHGQHMGLIGDNLDRACADVLRRNCIAPIRTKLIVLSAKMAFKEMVETALLHERMVEEENSDKVEKIG